MELTNDQREELRDLIDSLRKVPGGLVLIADGAYAHDGESDLSDGIYLMAECVKEKIEGIKIHSKAFIKQKLDMKIFSQ